MTGEPGMYVPIEVVRDMKKLLEVARCPNNDCIQGYMMGRLAENAERCQWCAERAEVLK